MPTLRLVDAGAQAGRLRIAAHLTTHEPETTGGTFVATGLVTDSGVLPQLERFAGLREKPPAPVVVQGAESFAGAAGRIAIAYDGVFRPVAPGMYSGQGGWRITGGDHAYKGLEGDGNWTATAVVIGSLTLDVVYEGTGRLG